MKSIFVYKLLLATNNKTELFFAIFNRIIFINFIYFTTIPIYY